MYHFIIYFMHTFWQKEDFETWFFFHHAFFFIYQRLVGRSKWRQILCCIVQKELLYAMPRDSSMAAATSHRPPARRPPYINERFATLRAARPATTRLYCDQTILIFDYSCSIKLLFPSVNNFVGRVASASKNILQTKDLTKKYKQRLCAYFCSRFLWSARFLIADKWLQKSFIKIRI